MKIDVPFAFCLLMRKYFEIEWLDKKKGEKREFIVLIEKELNFS